MAKRFIDTAIFEDEWFMELQKKGKLAWIYCFTKCDHAGIIKLNKKLGAFETGMERPEFEKALDELKGKVVPIDEDGKYGFLAGFIKYQYPDYPNPKNKVHASVIKRLHEFGIADSEGAVYQDFLGANKGLGSPSQGAKEKEEEKDRDTLPKIELEELGQFQKAWLDFLEYRQNSGKGLYKTQQSERTMFKKLVSLAGNSPERAQKIVNQSIAYEWQGLFQLKDDSRNNNQGGPELEEGDLRGKVM